MTITHHFHHDVVTFEGVNELRQLVLALPREDEAAMLRLLCNQSSGLLLTQDKVFLLLFLRGCTSR